MHQINIRALRNDLLLFQTNFNKSVYLAYQTTTDYNRKVKETGCMNTAKLAKEETESTHRKYTQASTRAHTLRRLRSETVTAEATEQKGKNGLSFLTSSPGHWGIIEFSKMRP